MNRLNLAELEQTQPKIKLNLVLFCFGVILLIVMSFISLKLDIADLFSSENWHSGVDFLAGFAHPTYNTKYVLKIIHASFETLAMSIIGTLIATILGLSMALAATSNSSKFCYSCVRLILNALRSIPELVWAAILLVALGLGPFPGTVALALHTTGVLGRLLTESIENLPAEPGRILRLNGASQSSIFMYTTLPLLLPQLTRRRSRVISDLASHRTARLSDPYSITSSARLSNVIIRQVHFLVAENRQFVWPA